MYTQTAHILYRGSKCCTHWPQIGGAGDTGHTPDTAIPQKLPTFVLLHQNIHTLCWSDLKVTVHKYANPTLLLPLTICSYLYQHSTGQIKHSVFCTFGSTLAGRRSCRPKGSSSTLVVCCQVWNTATSLLWRLYIVRSLRAAAGDTSQEDPLREDFD